MAYATVEQLRKYTPDLTFVDDSILQINLDSATDRITTLCKQTFTATETEPIPAMIIFACMYYAKVLYVYDQAAGLDNERIDNRSYKVESPEVVDERFRRILSSYMQPTVY